MAISETHKLDVNGATLHLAVDGPADGPAILLWNGAACTTHMWDRVVPQLSDHFRLIRFDVRGTGQSTPGESDGQYTLEQYAEDAVRILDHLGHEQSIVWSMAWGSRAALVYAATHPGRVSHLALFDASVARADAQAQAAGRKRAFAAQKAAGIPVYARPEGWNTHLDSTAMQKALAAAGRFDNLAGVLDQIEAPTLVATGNFDPNLDSSRYIAATLANARLEVMEGVGHGSVLQRPDMAVRVFKEFVGDHFPE